MNLNSTNHKFWENNNEFIPGGDISQNQPMIINSQSELANAFTLVENNKVALFQCAVAVSRILTKNDGTTSGRGFFTKNGNFVDYVLETALGSIYHGRIAVNTLTVETVYKLEQTTVS